MVMGSLKPFLMWFFPLSFFAYQFILRLWPSLMMQPIMAQFQIDATSFGLLASVYYYGYAGMQIPLAFLLEKWGTRKVLSLCAIVCGLSMILFATTSSWSMALLSRFLIGVGSAAGFLSVSRVVSEWFSQAFYGRMIGLSFSVGLMGAIYGGKPVSLLVEKMGGEKIALGLSFVSLLLGGLVFLFLKAPVHEVKKQDSLNIRDLRGLLKSPTLWGLALGNLLMVGSLEGFADVWGVNYLMTAYGFPQSEAAALVSFIFVGMLVGGPLLAFFSQKVGLSPVISLCGVGMAGAFVLLLGGGIPFTSSSLRGLFFGVGLLCCYQVLVFDLGRHMVKPSLLGMTVGFLNCINMLGGSFFHTMIGSTMDYFWEGAQKEGIRQYGLDSYLYGLGIIPLCALVGALLVIGVGRYIKKGTSS